MNKKEKTQQIYLKSGIDPNYGQTVLVSDIDTFASIFDLIDNSIDASRTNTNFNIDEYGMPDSYAGFKIDIFISEHEFKIIDNCHGFSRQGLTESVFIVGKPSNHSFGLGKFGVGLKRSLIKIGNRYHIKTDNNNELIILSLDRENIGNTTPIPAYLEKSTGISGTTVIINELNPEVVKELSNKKWVNRLHKEIRVRYSIFLKKGININMEINGETIAIAPHTFEVSPKEEYAVLTQSNKDKYGNVNYYIDSGIHSDYIMTSQQGVNRGEITNDYGWTVICNDRVIEFANSEGEDYGWTKSKLHGDFYGFVGFIRFISKDVSLLPWDSSKTKIATGSLLFLEVVDILSEHTKNFRSNAKDVRIALSSEPPSKPTTRPSKPTSKPIKPNESGTSKPRPQSILPRDRYNFIDWDTCRTES